MLRRTLIKTAAVLACAAAIPSAFAFAEGTDFIKLEKPLPGGAEQRLQIVST